MRLIKATRIKEEQDKLGATMKVLHINQIYSGFSTGRTTRQLGNALRKKGHRQYVAYAYGRKGYPHAYRIGGFVDHKTHALCSRITGLQGYYSYIPTWKLIHYIKVLKPDVVHLSNLHGNYIHLNMLLKFLGKYNIATVVTLHDCWFYTGRCTHYALNQCTQWQQICKKCPNENNTLRSWFFDRSKKMHQDKQKYLLNIKRLAVIGVSDWITKEAKQSFLKDVYLLKRIYNWVDLGIFRPGEEPELRRSLDAENKFLIVSVASFWGTPKGLDQFISLASRLREEEYLMVLVGRMPEDMNLPQIIKNIPLVTNASWLARLYRVGDVFITLSKEESFGKVIAESLACGTPVITYNMTACPETAGDNCGYVAKNNTLEDIYDGILTIKKNTKQYYTKNCVAFARKNFNKAKNTTQYIEVYKKLIDKI